MQRTRIGWLLLSLLTCLLLDCSSNTPTDNEKTSEVTVKSEGTSSTDGGATGPEAGPEKVPLPTQKVFGGKRPVTMKLPFRYDPSKPLPLLIILHGAGVSGELQAAYFGFTRLQEEEKFLMLSPNGTVSHELGGSIWNATDACCDLTKSIDDLGYIKGLIEDVKSVYRVDEKRVFLVGHSNGGFMSHRMACDASDSITAIASLAGTTFNEKSRCKPSRKINVLQIHGTKDAVIKYEGGPVPKMKKLQPGAEKTVDLWKDYNGCTGSRKASETKLDLIADLAGDETTVQVVAGCPKGGAVELWTVVGAAHIPTVSPNFAKQVWTWLLEQTEQ